MATRIGLKDVANIIFYDLVTKEIVSAYGYPNIANLIKLRDKMKTKRLRKKYNKKINKLTGYKVK